MTAAVPEPPHLVTDLKTLCLATILSGQVKSEWNGRPSFLMPDRGGAEVDPRGPTAS